MGGGSASTTHTHETYRLIWTQGCKELGIPAEDWFKFDTEVFRRMAAWSLISIQLGKLDIFTTMLNKERQFFSRTTPICGKSTLRLKKIVHHYTSPITSKNTAMAQSSIPTHSSLREHLESMMRYP